MTALKIQVSAAGRAALVNATNTGTLPVTIAQIGVTSTAFTPAADGSDLVLPGELKRLSTFGGAAVAADTIHITIRDDSADTYSLYGFGLYLADGTLFGLYGQAGVILEKSAQAMMLLATDIIFADIDAASLTFGDTSFLNPPATTDVQGVIELATDAETITGTDSVRAVTPKGLVAKLADLLGAGAPSAFVKGLLIAASAAAFRTALAIKGAALKDEGTGNGLDADLLDGQHGAYYRAYSNLTGVPGTFAPSPHTHPISDVVNLASTLATYAPLASPALSGVPTAPTPSALNNTTQIATTAFVQQVIANVINGSPGALDTLKELADAMGDDPNFAATVTNALAQKAPIVSPSFTGVVKLGSISPTTNQGFQFVWNAVTANFGRNEYINNFGAGTGGHYFYGRSTTADLLSLKMSIDMSGNVVASGDISGKSFVADTNFLSSSAYWVGAPANSTGAMLFRPNGVGSLAGQMELDPSGNLFVSAQITAVTGNFTASDENLKQDIHPFHARPLHRGHRNSTALSSYTWTATGCIGISPIAQDVLGIAPEHVGSFETADGEDRLSINYGGYATELATWAAVEVDRLTEVIADLQSRLQALEH